MGGSSGEQSDSPERLAGIETIEAVAGSHAGFATSTPIEINLESELLSRARRAGGKELAVATCLRIGLSRVVAARESFYSREILLLAQHTVEDGQRDSPELVSGFSRILRGAWTKCDCDRLPGPAHPALFSVRWASSLEGFALALLWFNCNTSHPRVPFARPVHVL
jgi:hypothetical protein